MLPLVFIMFGAHERYIHYVECVSGFLVFLLIFMLVRQAHYIAYGQKYKDMIVRRTLTDVYVRWTKIHLSEV